MDRRHFLKGFGGTAVITSFAGCESQRRLSIEEIKERSTTISCDDYQSEEFEDHNYLHFEEMIVHEASYSSNDEAGSDPNQYYLKIAGDCGDSLTSYGSDFEEFYRNIGIFHAELSGETISSRIGSRPADDLFEVWGETSGKHTLVDDFTLETIAVSLPSIEVHSLEHLRKESED